MTRFALTAAAVLALTAPAEAKTVCKPRSEMVQILARNFNEHQRAFGLQNDRRVLELYVSAEGTWTAILSMPNGQSCVVAAGEAFTTLPALPSGEPA
jgi:predicted methyltransferase